MILCPICNGKTEVTDSRKCGHGINGIRRRRSCEDCGERFSTHETIVDDRELPLFLRYLP